MDEKTLVVQYLIDGLWMYTLNNDSTFCQGEMIDNDFAGIDVSCSQDGKVYVTGNAVLKTSVRIYTIQNRTREVLEIDEVLHKYHVGIAVNNDFIVMDHDNKVFVFNKDMVLLYDITLDRVNFITETYLTDTDKLWFYAENHPGPYDWSYEVLVFDLHTKEYDISKGHLEISGGVSGIQPNIVFVNHDTEEIRMYSDTGVFRERIQIDPPVNGTNIHGHAAFRTREGKVLIAIDNHEAKVPIYSFNL